MTFLSVFASYLLVFVVFVAAIVVAAFLGIGLCKLINKNKVKEVQEDEYHSDEAGEKTEENN